MYRIHTHSSDLYSTSTTTTACDLSNMRWFYFFLQYYINLLQYNNKSFVVVFSVKKFKRRRSKKIKYIKIKEVHFVRFWLLFVEFFFVVYFFRTNWEYISLAPTVTLIHTHREWERKRTTTRNRRKIERNITYIYIWIDSVILAFNIYSKYSHIHLLKSQSQTEFRVSPQYCSLFPLYEKEKDEKMK